jgi:cupin 2 domain-containing protein
MLKISNILANIPSRSAEEVCESLAASGAVRIERIVSHGHVTQEGEWYDQKRDEWVMVVSGAADLLCDGDPKPHRMIAGDYLMIPAHCRHRVSWTDPDVDTVWLAVHYDSPNTP